MTATTVGVVGLGAMGSRIALRFIDAGHEVVVWNRTPAKSATLIERGAHVAESPAEATRRAEAVITMVSDPAALAAVTQGADGVAAGAGPSTTVLQMATVGPGPIRRLAAALPAGAVLLDVPVLGSLGEVDAGTLRIFAGGPEALVERWTPFLSRLGTVLHAGPIGAGSVAKLVANSTLFMVLGGLGEALALADRSGLADDVTYDVLAATALAAPAERRRSAIDSGEYPLRFSLSLALKDADLILEAGQEVGLDLRVVRAARAWLADAERAGLGDADYSTVLGYMLRRTGAGSAS